MSELLELGIHLPTLHTFFRNSLGQDARLILDGCRNLKRELQQPPSCPELEGYARDLRPMLVKSYSRVILQTLSYDTRLKLTLIVWHFDSPGLRAFLRSPIDETAWETLYARYLAHSRQQVLYDDFIHSFDFLLSSQWPPSRQTQKHSTNQPESGDSRDQPQPPQTLVNRRVRSVPSLRRDQFLRPLNPSSSSPHNLQHFRAYTRSRNSYGRLYQCHERSLGAPVSGQDRHHAGSLPESQSSSLLPESHTTARSSRQNVATRSDLSTGRLQQRH